MNYKHSFLTKNYDLDQGKQYAKYKTHRKNQVSNAHLKRIQETTMKNLHSFSFQEGMTTMDMKNIENENSRMSEKMLSLQNEFQTTLQQYNDAYKEYLTQYSNVSQSSSRGVLGKNVRDENGKFYYVNKYGYARGYSQEAWSKKPSSCPSTTPAENTISIFHTLPRGADMGVGEPCNLEGNIVENTSNGRADWVTPEGRKQWFPNWDTFVADEKNHGCPPTNKWVKINNEEYNAIPSGPNMTSGSSCSTEFENVSLWNRILTLNDKLIDLAQQLYNEASSLEGTQEKIGTEYDNTKQVFLQQVRDLEIQRKELQKIQDENATLQGRYQDLKTDLRSDTMQYFAWTIGALTLSVYTYYHMTR